jgi:archaellum component FlaF (FlaF/FlaG flagellin family)
MSVSFVNMSAKPLSEISIKATLFNTEMTETWNKTTVINVASDEVAQAGIIVPETAEMQFLKLIASDSEGNVLSENLYWISKVNNYKALNTLPEPTIEASAKRTDSKANDYTVTLKNNGKTIAFMLRLKVCGKESHQEILPSYWGDNYFSLLPGEKREIKLHFSPGKEDFQLSMESWNGKASIIDLTN